MTSHQTWKRNKFRKHTPRHIELVNVVLQNLWLKKDVFFLSEKKRKNEWKTKTSLKVYKNCFSFCLSFPSTRYSLPLFVQRKKKVVKMFSLTASLSVRKTFKLHIFSQFLQHFSLFCFVYFIVFPLLGTFLFQKNSVFFYFSFIRWRGAFFEVLN